MEPTDNRPLDQVHACFAAPMACPAEYTEGAWYPQRHWIDMLRIRRPRPGRSAAGSLPKGMRLRAKDLDFGQHQILVRDVKGGKDRVTIMPNSPIEPLRGRWATTKQLHEQDANASGQSSWKGNNTTGSLRIDHRIQAGIWLM